jgi:N-acylneuraminate cytidylyltransferase
MFEGAIAIIPARGGSKGVPRKNLRLLAGRPLVTWTIEAARAARTVQRVVVSTDDAEIADVSRKAGAEIVERPPEISGDSASSESALLQCLGELKRRDGRLSDVSVFLQCTSPLTLAEDIDGTVGTLLDGGADSAFTATAFHHFLWQAGPSGRAVAINHDAAVRPRRQDREPQFRETGAVYAMRTAGFLRAGHRFFGKTAMHVTPADRSLEIDDHLDLRLAEILIRDREARRRRDSLPARVAAVVFDFDGVFTDNRVLVFQSGEEAVICDRADGWGLGQLRDSGVRLLVLSTEANPVVAARCRKLRIDCLQNQSDKLSALRSWLAAHAVEPSDVVYVGNDANDLSCLTEVACPVAVADAHPDALAAARIVLSKPGGRGAIREICDLILEGGIHHAEPIRAEAAASASCADDAENL